MEKKSTKSRLNSAYMSESTFETLAWNAQKTVVGIDEVGRGCFAGPVVACELILKPYATHTLLRDSKMLSEAQRNEAYAWIAGNAWYAFGIVDHRVIDEVNIYQATLIAMQRAYWGVASSHSASRVFCAAESIERQSAHYPIDTVLVDAMPLFLGNTAAPPVQSFIKGEQRSISIAAASIMAKVMRDALMSRLSLQFPHYALHDNKGYGTPSHAQALHTHGPTLIHRTTFIRSTLEQKESDHGTNDTYRNGGERQGSLFG